MSGLFDLFTRTSLEPEWEWEIVPRGAFINSTPVCAKQFRFFLNFTFKYLDPFECIVWFEKISCFF